MVNNYSNNAIKFPFKNIFKYWNNNNTYGFFMRMQKQIKNEIERTCIRYECNMQYPLEKYIILSIKTLRRKADLKTCQRVLWPSFPACKEFRRENALKEQNQDLKNSKVKILANWGWKLLINLCMLTLFFNVYIMEKSFRLNEYSNNVFECK